MQTLLGSYSACVESKTAQICVCLVLLVCVLWFLPQSVASGAQTESPQPLRGNVVFLDGTAAQGAKVRASAICNGVSLVQDATTAQDGSFSFPLFHREIPDGSDAACTQYRFGASKQEDFWLPSDTRVFTGVEPIVPTVNLPISFPLQPVQIVLRVRGGEVSFRVWEVSTGRFVGAGLDLDGKAIEGKKLGAMLLATGEDGSEDTLLLPPGEYTVKVSAYPARQTMYCPLRESVSSSFIVKPGTRLQETITIDARKIKLFKFDQRKCKQ